MEGLVDVVKVIDVDQTVKGEAPFFIVGNELEEAIAAADHAWKSWAETPAADKEAILLKAGDWMQEHIDEVAGVLMDESGSAFGKAYFEAGFAVDLFRAAAGECRRVFGEIQQQADRKSTRLNSSHIQKSRMPSSA